MKKNFMEEGDKAKISHRITGEQDWIEREIIDIENNPFIGVVISELLTC